MEKRGEIGKKRRTDAERSELGRDLRPADGPTESNSNRPSLSQSELRVDPRLQKGKTDMADGVDFFRWQNAICDGWPE